MSFVAPVLVVALAAFQSKPAVAPASQPATPREALNAEVDALFKDVIPELMRYGGKPVRIYGATRTMVVAKDGPVIEREVKLYEKRKAAGVISIETPHDRLLCFNLLLDRPAVGRAYFEAIVDSPSMKSERLVEYFLPELLVCEEWGEQWAVRGAKEKDVERRRACARYLGNFAAYASSRAPMEAWLATESDDETAYALLRGFAVLADRAAIPAVRKVLSTTSSDQRRAGAVFALVELLGRDFIPELETMKVDGVQASKEREEGLNYLRAETTPEQPHGYSVGNDTGFVSRFADLYSAPVIVWLKAHGRLERKAVEKAEALATAEKLELFGALEEGLVFGLAAVKGSLFKSLEPGDLPRLLKLRALAAYSPSSMSQADVNSLSIMIRSLRMK